MAREQRCDNIDSATPSLADDPRQQRLGLRVAEGPKVVAVTLYRRHGYAKTVLEALTLCDGVERYLVLLHVDPGCTEVEALAASFPLPRKQVVINPARLGCNGNIFGALSHGFSLAEYVILLEDDVVPARDLLRFFEHCDRQYRNDSSVLGACAYNREMPPRTAWHQLTRRQWFTPWGWATWRDRWQEMAAKWPHDAAAGIVWDWTVNHEVRGDRTLVCPRLARSQNIGAEGGEYCPGPQWHAEHQYNANWAGAVEVPEAEFQE
jgi:GNT-I family